MSITTFQKEQGESGLRLVPDAGELTEKPEIEKQFVNFLFLRTDPEWRKLGPDKKQACKTEFRDVFDGFRSDFLLYSYSLVGFDSKADLMLWRVGTSLDLVQEMTAKLYRTELGSYLETAANYLSVTKRMMFVGGQPTDRSHVEAGTTRYHFVYPCAKNPEWFEMPAEERDTMIKENFMVGQKFPNIKIHLTHAFGFNDHEYLISFETDEPRDFLSLAEELRETVASKLTLRGMPVYTCRQRPLMECLDALG
ncbi:MAG TPA: chlorite dismutase family protein [Pyrinomonadaceae bacterium]|nr:chlorite dismutase family protein [Pyrinomonadaceae bacterium]